jgi:hypothetical protein
VEGELKKSGTDRTVVEAVVASMWCLTMAAFLFFVLLIANWKETYSL